MEVPNRFLFFIVLCLLSFSASTQNTYEIKGAIVGPDSKPVEFANIALKSVQDSSLISGTTSDLDGLFSLDGVVSGNYLLDVSYLTLKDSLFAVTVANENVELGTVQLGNNSNTLGTVVVKSTVPVIVREIDRINFNVQSSAIASSGTVWEALKYAPGVQTDNRGKITLNGKKGVTVMINERPLQLSAEGIKDLLESMSADEISKIEVMANPSAKYDAEGTGGIINIVKKKNLSNGFNGLVLGGVGHAVYSRYNAGTSLNYRQDKLLLSAYYSTNGGKFQEIDRSFIDYGNSTWSDENIREKTQNNHFANMGMEYAVGKNAIVGAFVEGFSTMKDRENAAETDILLTGQTNPDSTLTTIAFIDDRDKELLGNIFYLQNFEKGSMRISANHAAFEADRDQSITTASWLNETTKGGFEEEFKVNSTQSITFSNFKTDVEGDLSEDVQYEAGLKISRIKTDNYNRHHIVQEGNVIFDPTRSDQFKYEEYIEALYFNLNGALGKFPYQVGLRAEYTQTKGESVSLDSITKRKYFRAFPSAFLQMPINDDHELGLSYSTRITRPKFFYLNPFRLYTNSFNYSEGNPFLQPSFSHLIELSYTLKGSYFFAIYFEKELDPYTQISEQDNETNEIRYVRRNVSDRNYFGLTTSIPIKVNDWWNIQINGDIYGKHENDIYLNERLEYTKIIYGGDIVSQFRIPNQDMSIEISGRYASPDRSFFKENNAEGDLSIGIRKYFLDKKMVVSLKASDLFKTNAPKSRVNFADQRVAYNNTWDSRSVQLTIRYRFGSHKVNSRKQRKSSADEEKNRLQ